MVEPRGRIICFLFLLVLPGTIVLRSTLVFIDYYVRSSNSGTKHISINSTKVTSHPQQQKETFYYVQPPTSGDNNQKYLDDTTNNKMSTAATAANMGSNGTATIIEKQDFACAPWIPREKRKILFHSGLKGIDRFTSWENYQSGNANYLGGEAYWSACIDYILKDLGFDVIITPRYQSKLYASGKEISDLQNGNIHRFVMDAFNGGMIDCWDRIDILCRMRFMDWWTSKHTHKGLSISPTRNDLSNTSAYFVPHFVHSEKTSQEWTTRKRKSGGRSIFIFVKHCDRLPQEILFALQSANFTLHMQCHSQSEKAISQGMREKITFHGRYNKPIDYVSKILQKVDMVIAFGEPTDSPTPLEALANGAAFIQPIFIKKGKITPMHKGLKRLGPPYVYNYDLTHSNMTQITEEIIKNAELASANPFVPFIPADYRYDAVRSYVCSNIIEYDACAARYPV